jgi:hypothetical protein
VSEDWHWTTDEGRYDSCAFPSREDAIAEAREYLDPEDGFWTGRAVQFTAADFMICPIVTLETCGEEAAEIVGEVAKDWPTALGYRSKQESPAVKELGDALSKVLQDWLDKHDPPTFFRVEDVQEHEGVEAS